MTHLENSSPELILERARNLCQQQGLKLTPTRFRVLEIIARSLKPIGAYEVLEQLSQQSSKGRLAPPTAYRAIDFLQQHQLIHRIERLNAYVACKTEAAGSRHHPQFFICTRCGSTLEMESAETNQSILSQAQGQGFLAEQGIVEVYGICQNCLSHSNSR